MKTVKIILGLVLFGSKIIRLNNLNESRVGFVEKLFDALKADLSLVSYFK